MEYLLHILVVIAIYATLAMSLDLLVGQSGLLSLAQASFFGLGAYVAGLVATRCASSAAVEVGLALSVTAVAGGLLAMGAFRLRGERLVLLTLAFQVLLVKVAMNWTSATGGPGGISAIPPLNVGGWEAGTVTRTAILAIGLGGVTWLVRRRLIDSPLGRLLRAVREDEALVSSLGKDPRRAKAAVFVVAGSLAGLAGVLHAHYIGHVAPGDFGLETSLLVVSMVVVGGIGSRSGPLLGAAALVSLPEFLRFLGLPVSVAANLQQAGYGLLLAVMMLARPRGFLDGSVARR